MLHTIEQCESRLWYINLLILSNNAANHHGPNRLTNSETPPAPKHALAI
jgi:hypothetical protein